MRVGPNPGDESADKAFEARYSVEWGAPQGETMELLDDIQAVLAVSSTELGRHHASVRGPATAPSSARSPSRADRKVTGSERSDAAGETEQQQLQRSLDDVARTLEESGVALKFKAVHDQGVLQIEISEKNSDKVLMRIPSDGMLRFGKDGVMTVGGLLNKLF